VATAPPIPRREAHVGGAGREEFPRARPQSLVVLTGSARWRRADLDGRTEREEPNRGGAAARWPSEAVAKGAA